jgi:hypothetical protein
MARRSQNQSLLTTKSQAEQVVVGFHTGLTAAGMQLAVQVSLVAARN